jgi:alkylation response protein AidB-like acyl-CoA dehydrogenase
MLGGMIPYTPPLADIRFLLTRLIGIEPLAGLPGYDAVTEDLIEAVLDETAKIASDVFAPLNEVGDRKGAKFENGVVTMPSGFKDAYWAFVDGGWNGLAVDTEAGGQGLPASLALPVQEMLQSANLSLALCTLLNQGAVELLSAHGSQALRAKFLPKLVSGEWTGTMNLTEPQAGSDVGAVKSRAERKAGHYLITGQKIFISYGDHDLTGNILHFVLARLPDAPEGTKGLSLFLVPKILVKDDGSLGEANDVRTVSIEHKLGQHASPTCVLAFGDKGGAVGYRVGAENGGIAAMFTMMNNARIGVGVQGLGLMERAWQQARDYAKTRVQGRDIAAPKGQPVAIIVHPDVRRMLLWMRAHTEAARALAYSCAYAVDVARRSDDDQRKQAAALRVDLLTPIVKAWITDLSNEVTSVAVQVCGGMGYIEETGVAQHMRDARVLAIYEGTNGIQANDLVFRKITRDNGAAFRDLLGEVEALLPELQKASGDAFPVLRKTLSEALAATRDAGAWILETAKIDAARAAASAAPFLRLTGNTLGGYYLFKTALLAAQDAGSRSGDPDYLAAKIITAWFYAEHVLPMSEGLARAVKDGGGAILQAEGDKFFG